MNPGPTFDRVYRALKDRIVRGELAPGDHLEPAALGREMASSITPVRDALHRLVGERIIEAPDHNGFRVPLATEAELRALYGWNLTLLDLGLRRRPGSRTTAAPETGAATVPDLFLAIGKGSGNSELEASLANIQDRLAPVRLVEAFLFDDVQQEGRELIRLFADGDVGALRRAIGAYHRRRQRRVGDLVVLMRHPRRNDEMRSHADPG